jgi:hypothetical protein
MRYLWGFELAGLLKDMVDNGLVITLILDCCFSASVYRRDDANVRFLPYDPRIDSSFPSQLDYISGGDAYRDASMDSNWLIRPDRYAILTACGPHEESVGLKVDADEKSYSPLSYFLLKTIECVSLTKRHKDIHAHLCAKFQERGLQQTPVLYGNRNQGFFGLVDSDITPTAIPIVVKSDGALQLRAGHAHGVKINDQLILYPFGSGEGDARSEGDLVTAKVTNARALTSQLEPLNIPSIRIRTGWMARSLTHHSLKRFAIRLAPNLPLRRTWLTTLEERSLAVHDDRNRHPFAFDVIWDNGKHKVLDKLGREIVNLASLLQDQSSVGQMGSILEHLARFRLAEDLVNESPTDVFRQSFKVQFLSNGRSFDPDRFIELKHNSTAELVLHNYGSTALYLFVYNLGPSWQVENLHCGTYIVVEAPKNGRREQSARKKVQMEIPDEMVQKGLRSCKDILKVFVTAQPTTFDMLELPKLGEHAKIHKSDRTGEDIKDGEENWVAMNFLVRTSFEGDIVE